MVLKKVFDKKVEVGPRPALKPEQWPAEVEDGNGDVVKVDGGVDDEGEADKVSDASSGDSVYAAAQRWAADYLASLDYPAYREDLKSAVIRAYLLVQHTDLTEACKEAVAMLIRNVD